MMKKLMIKNWAAGAARILLIRPLSALWGLAERKFSPPLKVKLTRNSLMILLPASHGGQLHILPRPGGATGTFWTCEVTQADDGYSLIAGPQNQVLATYAEKSDAAHALLIINKALTDSQLWKWGFRIFLAWLLWLFVTSYIEVSQRQAAAGPDVLGYAPAQDLMPVIPSEPAPYQTTPSVAGPAEGDLSSYIYEQAMKAQKDALPPKVGVDNPAGLAAFGLKAEGGSGEGCDPKLAFQAPQK